ncbi:TetR/AcrR family transcriptional regulator C-terminal domain-containing protein [Actinocatenispora sera]|nr:TetR/AcrR family transcriptional regulator C-terminal domain-containing protein [Actinocatenispora sera]
MDADTIVRAALALLKEEGLAGVTFRKLSASLEVKAPAIYWRFRDKRELLDAVADALLRETLGEPRPMPAGSDWRRWYVELLHRLRRAMLAYPDGARVVAGARPPHTPTLACIPEYGLRAIEASGRPLPEAAAIVYTALHYTFGHVIEEQDSADAEPTTGFARRYPTVARAMTEAGRLSLTPDAIFAAGLALIFEDR